MHGVWDAMDLAGNAEDCALPPENYKPCKKAKKQIFLRERAPDKICFYLFCMACSFREKSACIMEKGMVD